MKVKELIQHLLNAPMDEEVVIQRDFCYGYFCHYDINVQLGHPAGGVVLHSMPIQLEQELKQINSTTDKPRI